MTNLNFVEKLFKFFCFSLIALPLTILFILIGDVIIDSIGRIGWDFLTNYPSRKPEFAGILPGIMGSLCLIGLSIIIALPVGIGAAIYLEEYKSESWFNRLIEINITNLAGVPSVIYGLLGLEVFVRFFIMDRSIIAGSCTIALLMLPIIIISAREAFRMSPYTLREAAFALGATRWQVIKRIVLPSSVPIVMTGSILAVSRAIGEAAPIIVVGAVAFITYLPTNIYSYFTTLPIQIFNWVSRPQESFLQNAAAGIVIMLVTLGIINGTAIFLRDRMQKRRSV